MKGKEYLIGLGESAGFLLLAVIPSASVVPILIIISFVLCCKEKPWEIPSSLFTSTSVLFYLAYQAFFWYFHQTNSRFFNSAFII